MFEKKSGFEKIKSKELNPKILITTALVAMGLSLAEKSEAQYTVPYSNYNAKSSTILEVDSTTMEIKNPYINNSIGYEITRQLVLEQRKELLDYLNSERYLQLLLREFCFINNPRIGEILDLLNSASVEDKIKLEDVFPKPDISNLVHEQISDIHRLRRQRVKNIEQQKWIIIDDPVFFENIIDAGTTGIYFSSDTTKYDTEYYNGIPLNGVVAIKCPLGPNAIRTPFHEFIHQSLDVDKYLLPLTKNLLDLQKTTDNEYLKQATEVLARIGVFRKCLKDEGICDPFTNDVTEEDLEKYEKLRETIKPETEDFNIEQLFQTLNKKDILWFLNNTAAIPEIAPDNKYWNLAKKSFDSRYV